MNNMNFAVPTRWYKKKKWWVVAVVAVLLLVVVYRYQQEDALVYEKIITQRADLVQEVSVTGKIKPAQSVDLQFENSGRISTINYSVGNKVGAGAVIASLENQELQAAVVSARADLDKTIRNFNSLNDPAISSTLRVELENAKENLEQVNKKAEGDLASKYNGGLNVMREAMTQVDSSSAVLEYLRKTYLEAKYNSDDIVKQYQAQTGNYMASVRTTFPAINESIVSPDSYSQFDAALRELSRAAQSVRSAFSYLQSEVEKNPHLISSATDRSNINSEASAISADLSAVSSAIQGIVDQRITNTKSISDAQAKLASAEASFPTREDVTQKESALLSAQAQLRRSIIVAPFAGTIGKIPVERGQTVNSSVVIVTLISSGKYQIEANITEIDIGKVKVGDPAKLTLDSYGSQTVFSARVSAIDAAATIIDGVTTYKVLFDFEESVDEGIRPEMTANVDVETAMKSNVISVPQRAVITKDGVRIVRIYKGDNVPYEERAVQLGMTGKDGYVEVTGGLSENESVITFIND